MGNHVLVVGSVNLDYVIHTERLPKLGETLTGSGFAVNLGGKGANQAVALAKAGCEVRMLAAVGTDSGGEFARASLEGYGVNCDAVRRVAGPTGAAVITVCGGDNHILLDEGANRAVTPETVAASGDLFTWADEVVLQLEIPTETVVAAARAAKKAGARVVLNPAPAKALPDELFPLVDWMIPNEFEAGTLTGIPQNDENDAEAAVAALRKKGCADAIITLGKRGCVYSDGNAVRRQGVFRVTPVDTTAAGDSFIGGFCAKLCEGADVDDAILYATATSAVAIGRPGAAPSIPSVEEVAAFLQTHKI